MEDSVWGQIFYLCFNCCPGRYFDFSKIHQYNGLCLNLKVLYRLGGWRVDAWADGELIPSTIYLILCGYLNEVYIYTGHIILNPPPPRSTCRLLSEGGGGFN